MWLEGCKCVVQCLVLLGGGRSADDYCKYFPLGRQTGHLGIIPTSSLSIIIKKKKNLYKTLSTGLTNDETIIIDQIKITLRYF